jgi:hypothetical protein
MHVIVTFFLGATFAGACADVDVASSCVNLTLIVGDEKVKLSACNLIKPSLSETKTVAT